MAARGEAAGQREFRSRDALRRWFEKNHASADPFWLVTWKKHAGGRYLPYDEIVDELLCFGWIDSRTRRLDEDRTMLYVSPRKPGSSWSGSNKRRIARLAKEGRLTPAGTACVDAAKKDGSWTFLDDVERLEVPPDLARALDGNPRARNHFDAFNASAKKIILHWIKTAKRDDTRAHRVSETVRLAAQNVRAAHPEAKDR